MNGQSEQPRPPALALRLVPSPHGPAADREFRLEENTATMLSHLDVVRASRVGGVYVQDDALWWVRDHSPWVPLAPLAGMPRGVWMRLVNAAGELVVPVEILCEPDDGGYCGRWLDMAGDVLPLAGLDFARMSAAYVTLARDEHERVMDSWRRFGGWQLVGGRWLPPLP